MASSASDTAPDTNQSDSDASRRRRRSDNTRQAAWVGGVTIVAAVLLFAGIRFMQNVSLFDGAYTLVAAFESADGLLEGNPVKVNGLRVGAIQTIRLPDSEPGVEVVLRIQEGIDIPRQSTASIEGLAALDNVYVSITRGPLDQPRLEPGSTIQTADTDLLGSLQSRVLPLAGVLDTTLTEAADALGAADRVIGQVGQELPATLSSVRATSQAATQLMRQQEARLDRILRSLAGLTASLDQVAGRLDRYTATEGDTLAQAVEDLNVALRQLRGTTTVLERSSSDLALILARVEDGSGTLGMLVNDASLYHRLDSAALRLDRILADIEEHPLRYVRNLRLIDVF